ncbi:MAG: hypothetical protein KGL46_01075 [Hyphomicrobiales bacterium]|nr:hypothetical protein [Hyphomicrobiales bacterium]
MTRLAIALLLIATPVASIATRRAIYVLAPVGVVLTLIAWLLAPGDRGPRELRRAMFSTLGLLSIFLTIWAAASLLWTPFVVGPTERFAKTASIFALTAVAAALLPERTRTSNLYLLPIGAAAGSIALIALVFFGPRLAVNRFDPEFSLMLRAAYSIALLGWPALGALAIRQKPQAAVALAFIMAAAIAVTRDPLAYAAVLLAAGVFVAAIYDVRRTGFWLGNALAALMLAAPLAALAVSALAPHVEFLRPAAAWGDVLTRDGLLRALIGHGYDSARLGVQQGYLDRAVPQSILFEVWFELGVVGALAMAFVLKRAASLSAAAPNGMAPYLLAGLTATFALCAFGLGVAPVWWATLLALAGFAFALLRHGHPRKTRHGPQIKTQTFP